MSIVTDFVQIRSLDEISDSFCPTFVCSDASLYHSNLTISPTIGEKITVLTMPTIHTILEKPR